MLTRSPTNRIPVYSLGRSNHNEVWFKLIHAHTKDSTCAPDARVRKIVFMFTDNYEGCSRITHEV
jgi:hypothetical protein